MLETEKRKCSCFLVLVRKVVPFQNYANGGGGEVESSCGVVVASSRFQIAIFQIKDYQNGVRDTFNFHFSFFISKKRSKTE